jgi:hypothetical protein
MTMGDHVLLACFRRARAIGGSSSICVLAWSTSSENVLAPDSTASLRTFDMVGSLSICCCRAGRLPARQLTYRSCTQLFGDLIPADDLGQRSAARLVNVTPSLVNS